MPAGRSAEPWTTSRPSGEDLSGPWSTWRGCDTPTKRSVPRRVRWSRPHASKERPGPRSATPWGSAARPPDRPTCDARPWPSSEPKPSSGACRCRPGDRAGGGCPDALRRQRSTNSPSRPRSASASRWNGCPGEHSRSVEHLAAHSRDRSTVQPQRPPGRCSGSITSRARHRL